MAKKLHEVSIFFPFWNEEKNIERVVLQALIIAPKAALKWEIIIVDDGSSDGTLEIARKIKEKNPNIRIISHEPNRGYGAALKEGFENAKYKYIVFTDGDGQFDFSEVSKFIEKIETCDLVIGYRKKREDKLLRHILMNLLKIWDFVFFGFWFRDIDCGFKMFEKESLGKIMPFRSEGAMITTEILAKAIRKKLKIKQVEVTHYPRRFGTPSGANIPVVARAVLESLILWLDIHNRRI
ncbi:MAG: glycosyltransferase family 2 protein [bacterium]|nr:glycosyltransferase family 2 protein [bacterium]